MKNTFKIIFFLFLVVLLIACDNDNSAKELGIKIVEYPQLTYYIDEEYNFDNLKVALYYDNDEEIIIDNYKLLYDDKKIGDNTITINYKDFNISFIVKVYENKPIGIKIINYPKLNYSYNENYDFKELEVALCFENGNEYLIDDYQIFYDDITHIGENIITISYMDFNIYFSIYRDAPEKLQLLDYSNYKELTTMNINYENYSLVYNDVYYGEYRDTNMFIVFDEINFVKTNIYGYEVAVDKYGKVIEKDVNVSLPKGGMVLSAHGTRKKDVENINIGDYVLFIDKSVYVYKDLKISDYNDLFLKFYECIDYLDTVNDVIQYNEIIKSLNNAIPLLEQIFIGNNLIDINLIEDLLNVCDEIDLYDHNLSYSYNDYIYSYLNVGENLVFDYKLSSIYDGTFYVGGYRNADSLVLYDKDHYRERNNFGYEVSVNKDGIVVSKDVLVDLEEGGYILSGHSSAATFIIDNININDKVEIKDNKVYVYRDYFANNAKLFIDERNSLIDKINDDIENEIPHDYNYINFMVTKLDELLSNYIVKDKSIYNLKQFLDNSKTINEYIAIIYSLLIEWKVNETHGIWYYPFFKTELYDDTSYEGVIKTLDKLKKMGINEIIISPFKNGYCLFESNIFQIYPELNNYDYGKYGKDYLKCFIEEAHKRNICVNAFTQTFSEHISTMYNGNEEYYQINYQGEKSKGNIYYYDICNDEVQNQLIEWYKELVSKYEFDKVEYDIIRYPDSNLYNYLDVDVIPDSVTITDHGYTEYSMSKFMNLHNLIGDLKILIRNDKDIRNKWQEFKEQNLIDFITKCTYEMKNINKNLVVTAAVFSDPVNAKNTYLQDYDKWLKLSIIDEIDVMCYTFSNDELINYVSNHEYLMENYSVRTGISPRLYGRSILNDVKQILYTNKYQGFILFSSTLYYDDLLKNILVLSNLDKDFSCLNNDQEILEGKIRQMILMIENYYSKINNYDYNDLINQLSLNQDIFNNLNSIEDAKMKNYLLEYLYN